MKTFTFVVSNSLNVSRMQMLSKYFFSYTSQDIAWLKKRKPLQYIK